MKSSILFAIVLSAISTLSWAEDDCTPPPNASGCLSEGLASAYKDQGKKTFWGFVDAKGKTVIPFKYQNVGDFKEGLASATLNNKAGMIDKTGKTVIPFKYDTIGISSEGLISVGLKGKQGFIDKQNKIVIPLRYSVDEVGADGGWEGSPSVDRNYFSEGLSAVMKNNKWGFIDKQGNQVIPFKYDQVGAFSDGLAGVMRNDDLNSGFIDKTGKLVIPFMYRSGLSETYSYIPNYFKNGKAQVETTNGDTICINKQNKQVNCD